MARKVSLCPHPCRIITSNPSSLTHSLPLCPPHVLHCCDASPSPAIHPSLCSSALGNSQVIIVPSLATRLKNELFDEANLKVRIDTFVDEVRDGGSSEWRR